MIIPTSLLKHLVKQPASQPYRPQLSLSQEWHHFRVHTPRHATRLHVTKRSESGRMIRTSNKRSLMSTLRRKAHRKLAAVASSPFLPWSRSTSRVVFRYFQMLPPEIRQIVWEHFLGVSEHTTSKCVHLLSVGQEKYADLNYGSEFMISDQSNIRAALQACRESAAIVALRGFQRCAGPSGSSFYLRPQDYINFPEGYHLFPFLHRRCGLRYPPTNCESNIRRLSLRYPYPGIPGQPNLDYVVGASILRFPNLAEIVVYFDGPDTHPSYSSDELQSSSEVIRRRWKRQMAEDLDRKITEAVRDFELPYEFKDFKLSIMPEFKFMTSAEFFGEIVEDSSPPDDLEFYTSSPAVS
jgi:hypothetical protein